MLCSLKSLHHFIVQACFQRPGYFCRPCNVYNIIFVFTMWFFLLLLVFTKINPDILTFSNQGRECHHTAMIPSQLLIKLPAIIRPSILRVFFFFFVVFSPNKTGQPGMKPLGIINHIHSNNLISPVT